MKKVSFGAKLIEFRKAKGLTQEDVAEKCNITVRTIQRIESESVEPRTFTIKAISQSLGFDFFEISNTSLNVLKNGHNSNLTKHTALWYVKDLFNLKTNTMRKVSILTGSITAIVFSVFLFNVEIKAQSSSKIEHTSKTETGNYLNVEKNNGRIQLAFNNNLTFDKLSSIKSDLNEVGITINYKKLEFDKNDKLLSINCEVDCNDGFKGGFSVDSLNSVNKESKIGFYRDYSEKSKSTFGTGPLKKIIIIDVGHGGHDNGAKIYGVVEKEIVLKIANKIKELNNSNDTEIILTRNSDEFVTLRNRVKLINSLNAEYMISLHVSEYKDETMKGSIFYTSTQNEFNDESNILAQIIKKSLQVDTRTNEIRNANFYILKNVNCPATVIELGFLTNEDDRKFLISRKGQDKIAKAIIEALL